MTLTGSYTYVVKGDTPADYTAYLDWLVRFIAAHPDCGVTYTVNAQQRRITLQCQNAPVIIPGVAE